MNMYQYKDILILATLLTNLSALFCSQPAQQPTFAGKLEFFNNRKPSLELTDLIAIIQATDSLPAAAQALAATKKRVMEFITTSLTASWCAQLDAAYSDHVASHIVFDYEHEQKTVSDLFALYHCLETQLQELHRAISTMSDEEKSEHLETMLMVLQRGKALETFLDEQLVPTTPLAQTWHIMSNTMDTLVTATKKTMSDYAIYKSISPADQATFDGYQLSLRQTKSLASAQVTYASAQAWVNNNGSLTPAEKTTWLNQLAITYQDQTTKTLPQLQIANIYGKSKLLMKTLRGYATV